MSEDDAARIERLCAELRARLRHGHVHYRSSSPEAITGAPPLATEEEIRETERALGSPLPPFLRAFYQGVVNASFTHAVDSLAYYSDGGCRSTPDEQSVAHSLSRSCWQIHPHIVEVLRQRQGAYVFSDERPDGFITLGADATHMQSVELDLRTGRVFLVGYDGDTLPGANGEDICLMKIFFGADSLEDWFERWLKEGDFYLVDHEVQLRMQDVDVGSITDEAAVWHGLYRVEPRREDDGEEIADTI